MRGGVIRTVLAVNIIANQAERALPTGVHGHDGDAIANRHPARLRHLNDHASRFVPDGRRIVARRESFELRAHGRGQDLDHHPVIVGAGLLKRLDRRPLHAADRNLLHVNSSLNSANAMARTIARMKAEGKRARACSPSLMLRGKGPGDGVGSQRVSICFLGPA